MKLSDYNTMKQLVRELGHQYANILRRAKRYHKAAEARGVTAEILFRSKLNIPAEYTVTSDGKVYDAENNMVGDYASDMYDCNRLLSALTGLRVAAAVLENDESFLQRGVTGIDWWAFVEAYMDDSEIGGL